MTDNLFIMLNGESHVHVIYEPELELNIMLDYTDINTGLLFITFMSNNFHCISKRPQFYLTTLRQVSTGN